MYVNTTVGAHSFSVLRGTSVQVQLHLATLQSVSLSPAVFLSYSTDRAPIFMPAQTVAQHGKCAFLFTPVAPVGRPFPHFNPFSLASAQLRT